MIFITQHVQKYYYTVNKIHIIKQSDTFLKNVSVIKKKSFDALFNVRKIKITHQTSIIL